MFYKELKISSFDPALATTLGINAQLMHYLLMTLVAITTVAAFESIGSILVIAMLIVPPATAHLLTDRLPGMIVVSLIVGAASAALGHVAAITVPGWFGFADTTTSGMMATVAGILFATVAVLAPRHGVLSKYLHQRALRARILREDALGVLFRLEEIKSMRDRLAVDVAQLLSATSGVSRRSVRMALRHLRRRGLLEDEGQSHRLTARGRARAADLVRTHRLWESYLHQYLPLPSDHVHATAERLEHVTDASMQDRLAEATDRPQYDPHGKRIPERSAADRRVEE